MPRGESRLRVLTAPLIPVLDNAEVGQEPELIGYLQIARLLTEYDRTLSSLSWMLWSERVEQTGRGRKPRGLGGEAVRCVSNEFIR